MSETNNKLAILVMSCDKYKGVWNDFFNLKEKYWPDCPYMTYLATDTVEYERAGVNIIHFGNIRTWTVCVRESLKQVREPYVALFLEDAFIYKTVDSSVIASDLEFVINNNVDFMGLERDRMGDKTSPAAYESPHIWKIHKNCRYGIETSAAIWRKEFFVEQLEQADCNAWQFEVNLFNKAVSREGLPGRIFFDDRLPFNISPVEVIRVGKLRPQAIKFFKDKGYNIDITSMPIMTKREVIKETIRDKASSFKFGRGLMKKIGKALGFYTYTTKK